MIEIVTALGPVFVTGLFGVVMWRLERSDKDRRRHLDEQDKRLEEQDRALEAIKANTARLSAHDDLIASLSDISKELKAATEGNSAGVKVLMRYMLQRYHATYMMRGYITSHEKTEFLEAYEVYHAKGGNGTGESWKRDVDELPVRDDLPVLNPYLEILKKGIDT